MNKRPLIVSVALLAFIIGLSGCSNGASSISKRIDAIESVDESSLESLHAIEEDYRSLSDEEKSKVANHAELEKAIAQAEGMKNDREFLEALEGSVKNRMKQAGEEDEATLVNSELARLDDFRDCVYYDEVISTACAQYLSGLDAQKGALSKEEQFSEYQVLWNKGLVDRYAALNSLYEKHGLMKGNADFKADYVLSFEHNKKYYDALMAIEADLAAQQEAGSIRYDWSYDGALTMTMMNNTDYAFDTVFDIDAVRDDETVTETVQGFASAKPHAQYAFTVYIADTTATHVNWNNWYSDIYV